MNSESDLCKKADFSLKISEGISLINKDLAPACECDSYQKVVK